MPCGFEHLPRRLSAGLPQEDAVPYRRVTEPKLPGGCLPFPRFQLQVSLGALPKTPSVPGPRWRMGLQPVSLMRVPASDDRSKR